MKLRKSLERITLPDPAVAESDRDLLNQVNALPLEAAKSLAETYLSDREKYHLTRSTAPPPPELSLIHPTVRDFFAQFDEVRCLYMNLTLAFLGRPSWLPPKVSPTHYIVGHYTESEYLFVNDAAPDVFSIDLLSQYRPDPERHASLYHLVVYHHRRRGCLSQRD